MLSCNGQPGQNILPHSGHMHASALGVAEDRTPVDALKVGQVRHNIKYVVAVTAVDAEDGFVK